ncbi:DUF2934 domain-containing protein [Pararhizobium qamdonense]|uniref:DUF2934 domain-containing protein n=1 Tax=Pararhizobium qamdonense TaxID=3031126 RepID=UPI0023E12D89|nr:DUF2934 domain-containing protein [Pararhizobium qamdonense]
MTEISEDDIRLRAYALWESDGRPAGSHDVHWLQALRELTEEAGASGGDTPKKKAKAAKPKAAVHEEPVKPAARKRSKTT